MEEEIINLDAVNLHGRELLFIHTKNHIRVWVIRETPTLYIQWPDHQDDFNASLTAYNLLNKS